MVRGSSIMYFYVLLLNEVAFLVWRISKTGLWIRFGFMGVVVNRAFTIVWKLMWTDLRLLYSTKSSNNHKTISKLKQYLM